MDSLALGRKHRDDFERNGFVCIRGFYSPQDVCELNAYFERMIARDVPGMPTSDAFYEVKGDPSTLKYIPRLAKHDPRFEAMKTSDRWRQLAEGLLNDGATPQGIEWFNKCPRVGKATPPHQDGYYYMIEPNEGVHFWLALDPVDESNGCVRYLPGSHRRPMRPHTRGQTLGFSQEITDYGPADYAAEVPMIMQPGDLIAHHTLTVHRADVNTSDRNRRAMGVVDYAARAKVDKERSEAYQKKLMAELAQAGKI